MQLWVKVRTPMNLSGFAGNRENGRNNDHLGKTRGTTEITEELSQFRGNSGNKWEHRRNSQFVFANRGEIRKTYRELRVHVETPGETSLLSDLVGNTSGTLGFVSGNRRNRGCFGRRGEHTEKTRRNSEAGYTWDRGIWLRRMRRRPLHRFSSNSELCEADSTATTTWPAGATMRVHNTRAGFQLQLKACAHTSDQCRVLRPKGCAQVDPHPVSMTHTHT